MKKGFMALALVLALCGLASNGFAADTPATAPAATGVQAPATAKAKVVVRKAHKPKVTKTVEVKTETK